MARSVYPTGETESCPLLLDKEDWDDLVERHDEDPENWNQVLALIEDLENAKKDMKSEIRRIVKEKCEDKESIWLELKEALKPFEKLWAAVTPVTFVQVLEMVNEDDAVRFCEHLSMKIHPDEFCMSEMKHKQKMRVGEVVHIYYSALRDDYKNQSDWLNFDDMHVQAWAGTQILSLMVSSRRVDYQFSWTTVSHLFTHQPVHQAQMIHALSQTGADSGVFNTVVGHSLNHNAWIGVKQHYVWQRLFDFLFLVVLWRLAYYRRNGTYPPWSVSCFAAVLAIRSVVVIIYEISVAVHIFGSRISRFFTFFNCSTVLLEFGTGFVLIMIAGKNMFTSHVLGEAASHSCFLARHPVMFAFVIAAKWFQFTLAMLCTRWMGENVLPAFYAVTSKEALAYIAFLFLCYMMGFQAYFSLPIEENWGNPKDRSTSDTPWLPGLKIFRLMFLGDFDIFELGGTDPSVDGQIVRGAIVNGTSDDTDIDDSYRTGLYVGFVMLSVSVTVMFMNVGIGLLSNLYDEAKGKKRQIFQHYKADYTVRLLFWRVYFPDWLCNCGLCGCGLRRKHGGRVVDQDDFEDQFHEAGVWIASLTSELADEEDQTLVNIEVKLKNLEALLAAR